MKNKMLLYAGIFCVCATLGVSTFGMIEGDNPIGPRPKLTKEGQEKKDQLTEYLRQTREEGSQKELVRSGEPKLRGEKTGNTLLPKSTNIKKLQD